MTLEFRKASRKKSKLRLGISAPSGGGKTLSSLILAYGIIKEMYPELPDNELWEKIGLIDTEEGSGELYVGVHKYGITFGEYGYIRLSAPFTIAKYLEAIKMMENRVEIFIIDSTSHAWAGSGGLLEKQNTITQNSQSKNSYIAWGTVTPEQTHFIDAMLQTPVHLIATMRSKTEYAMQDGKVVKLGLAPVQRNGMEYEFTVFFDINENCVAHATKDRTDLFQTIDGAGRIEKRQFIISPETGKEIYRWLDTGKDAPEHIDKVAERIAGKVKISNNLEETYNNIMVDLNRIKNERPEYEKFIMEMFEKRNEDLQNTSA